LKYLRLHTIMCAVLLLLLAGCGTAVSHGTNTALGGADLIQMTDDMAMKLASSPAVQEAIARDGKLKIVVQPVENLMTAEVLPRGPSEAFTARIRSLLSKHAPGQFTWIMNRDAFYRLRGKELDVDLGPAPEAINPEYALTAKFSSITNEDSEHRSAYYLCVYELTNLKSRDVLWSDKYEVKKTAVKGFLD
jgi:hypothetical protein